MQDIWLLNQWMLVLVVSLLPIAGSSIFCWNFLKPTDLNIVKKNLQIHLVYKSINLRNHSFWLVSAQRISVMQNTWTCWSNFFPLPSIPIPPHPQILKTWTSHENLGRVETTLDTVSLFCWQPFSSLSSLINDREEQQQKLFPITNIWWRYEKTSEEKFPADGFCKIKTKIFFSVFLVAI